ncbi:hypothetical protein GBA52_014008 [Prunus armeniaca]|nr:hypothetical protein GBA52_014008 [Prunus armeniaca]
MVSYPVSLEKRVPLRYGIPSILSPYFPGLMFQEGIWAVNCAGALLTAPSPAPAAGSPQLNPVPSAAPTPSTSQTPRSRRPAASFFPSNSKNSTQHQWTGTTSSWKASYWTAYSKAPSWQSKSSPPEPPSSFKPPPSRNGPPPPPPPVPPPTLKPLGSAGLPTTSSTSWPSPTTSSSTSWSSPHPSKDWCSSLLGHLNRCLLVQG